MSISAISKPSREDLQATEFYQKHLLGAQKWLCNYVAENLESTLYCNLPLVESPLEAAFLAWWTALTIGGYVSSIDFQPQQTVNVGEKSYRLDIVLQPNTNGEFGALVGHPNSPRIAVEFDGHEFHERTKEQVAYRNERDRALLSAGWLVWHYSGSEFHRDPCGVAQTIYEEAYGACRKAMYAAGFWKARAVNA